MPIHKYIIIAFILVLSQDNALSQNNQTEEIEEVIVIGSRSVSYTHLTLPTNKAV